MPSTSPMDTERRNYQNNGNSLTGKQSWKTPQAGGTHAVGLLLVVLSSLTRLFVVVTASQFCLAIKFVCSLEAD